MDCKVFWGIFMKRNTLLKFWLIIPLMLAGALTSVTAQDSREPILSDHVPSEIIYTGSTMRDPLFPVSGGSVDCFLRVDVPGLMEQGILHYRINGAGWLPVSLAIETEPTPNEYWSGTISFNDMDLVEYYFAVTGTGYDATFVYGTDDLSFMTTDESTAMSQAFSFMVGIPPSPTPANTNTPMPGTATPTPMASETPTPYATDSPTPMATDTPSATATPPPPTVTNTPTNTPTGPVTDTPTPTVETPTPTMGTPTSTPGPDTPTPVPSPNDYQLDLVINQTWFNAGDQFRLDVIFYNNTPHTLVANLIVLLDVHGQYFFYPEWISSLDWEQKTNRSQATTYIILDFPWDEEASNGYGILFYAAMFDETFSLNYGDIDSVEFGWD